MEKKITMPEFDSSVVTCEFNLTRDGKKIDDLYHVVRYIPVENAFDIVRNALELSYVGEEGEEQYSVITKDYAIRYLIIDAYTDIDLPDTMEAALPILYDTDIFESVMHIAYEQADVIIDEINRYVTEINDQRRDHEKNTVIHNLLRMSDVVRLGIESLSGMFDQFTDTDTDQIIEALQQVAERIEAVAADSGDTKKEGE